MTGPSSMHAFTTERDFKLSLRVKASFFISVPTKKAEMQSLEIALTLSGVDKNESMLLPPIGRVIEFAPSDDAATSKASLLAPSLFEVMSATDGLFLSCMLSPYSVFFFKERASARISRMSVVGRASSERTEETDKMPFGE